MKKNTQINLIEGSIAKNIVRFAVPMFLGNLFQQLYNMADSLVVGNFLCGYINRKPYIFTGWLL